MLCIRNFVLRYLVQEFYQEYWVNLKLIATKAKSSDFDLLLCLECQKKSPKESLWGNIMKIIEINLHFCSLMM